jgi:hypothetical protein
VKKNLREILPLFTILTISVLALSACKPQTTSPTQTTPTSLTTSTSLTTDAGTIFPPVTVRDVPVPAPVPWHNITTYTEQTYQIEARDGEEFAIGMFATMSINFEESNDQNFIDKVDDKMVEYQPSTLSKYGTEWFLFKAINKGDTEIVFHYPLEYTKIFKISIH